MNHSAWAVLSRYRDFRWLFTGNSVSLFGSSVTTVALPLTAVVYLRASPAQMGFLGAAALLQRVTPLEASNVIFARTYLHISGPFDPGRFHDRST